MILPVLAVALINLTLGGINGVGMVFSLTGGGPGTATEVLSYLLYSIGFARLDFGLAASLSVLMTMHQPRAGVLHAALHRAEWRSD